MRDYIFVLKVVRVARMTKLRALCRIWRNVCQFCVRVKAPEKLRNKFQFSVERNLT